MDHWGLKASNNRQVRTYGKKKKPGQWLALGMNKENEPNNSKIRSHNKKPLCERSSNIEIVEKKKFFSSDKDELYNKVFRDVKLLTYILQFLESYDYNLVCIRWMTVWQPIANARTIQTVSDLCDHFESMELSKLKSFSSGLRRNFPRGSFLSDGSYKHVYKVWSQVQQRFEAISVMSMASINETSSLSIIAQEVKVSILVSDLVTSKECPNFIETYQVFASKDMPPEDLWGKSDSLLSSENDVFQYIRMELCDLGDLEELVKTYPDELPPMDAVKGMFFQMCFSLFKGQQKLQLRHFDIKLLNFFCKSNEDHSVVKSDRTFPVLVKLADFGTAEVQCEATKVAVDHICTLENTPPEFLLVGDAASTGCADVFALGLCFLHLLTGSRPYEEILERVTCPIVLKKLLLKIWCDGPNFTVLNEVLEDDSNDILYDTLYRYFVLFSLPYGKSNWGSNYGKVSQAIDKAMDNPSKNWEAFRIQLANDQEEFNLESGINQYINRGFIRSDAAGILLLKGLLEFDPLKRMTNLGDVLASSFFE